MIVRDQSRYEECMEIAANLRHAAHILDAFESFDEEFVTNEEFDIINDASEKLEKLAVIMRGRSKWYVVEES